MIELGSPPIGIRFFKAGEAPASGFRAYRGPSYCHAVGEATRGELVVVEPGSIEVCRWSPPVLGLKEPESDFEKEREPRLPFATSAIALGRLGDWPNSAGDPDVVLVRADRFAFEKLVGLAGPDRLYREHTGIDRTVIPVLEGRVSHPVKTGLVKTANQRFQIGLSCYRLFDH